MQRLGDQIHRELAMLMEIRLGDPRLNGLTITAVKVSRDLGHARVYYTTLSDDREGVEAGLAKAVPYLRHLLSSALIARITPRLTFIYDESIQRGRDMEALIRDVVRPLPATPGDGGSDGERDE